MDDLITPDWPDKQLEQVTQEQYRTSRHVLVQFLALYQHYDRRGGRGASADLRPCALEPYQQVFTAGVIHVN